MGSIGPQELLLVLVLALMVLGPDKLPEAARWLGRFYGDVKKMRSMVHQEVRGVMRDVMDPITDVANEVKVQAGMGSTSATSPAGGSVGRGSASPEPSLAADVPLPSTSATPAPGAPLGFDPSLN